MSKRLGILLAVIIMAAVAVPVCAQGAFEDVPMDHWAYQSVQMLAENGLVEGYPDGSFRGQQPMTRYEFAMIVARALQSGLLVGPPGEPGEPGPVGMGGGPALTAEQRAMLTKLQKEFEPELKRLRSDVDELEMRVSALEGKPTAAKPIVTVSGGASLRAGLYGTELEFGASDSTGYFYPGIAGAASWLPWFSEVGWGGINIPDGEGAESIPISDALKDSFKAPDFMTMRTHLTFDANLTHDVKAKVVLLADTRSNLVNPATDVDDWNLFPPEMTGATSPNSLYSDGLMDTVRVDEAWMKYNTQVIRPITITAGKMYWGFGAGLLANNSQHATKSGQVEIALTGDEVGDGITYTAVMAMLDREAFLGQNTSGPPALPNPPDPLGGKVGGQDSYLIHNVCIPLGGDWRVGGTYLGTGFGSERGWSANMAGKIFGLDLWGEYAELVNFPDGTEMTGVGVDIEEANTAWMAGIGYEGNGFSLKGQYGEVEPLYVLSESGWDPVGIGAVVSSGSGLFPIGYLNVPLSLMHPLEEFNPHYINWLDRPVFLDATNITKGWEVSGNMPKLISDKTGLSFRYYDGDAFSEEYLGWLLANNVGSRPEEWRDGDPVWSVTLTHHFTDALCASLTYGQREVDNVMATDALSDGIEDDPIKVLRLDLSVAF